MSTCPCCGQPLPERAERIEQRAAELADALRQRGHRVTVSGLITERAFADAVGRAAGTVRNWNGYGDCPIAPVRIRGRRWYRLADVAKFLHEGA